MKKAPSVQLMIRIKKDQGTNNRPYVPPAYENPTRKNARPKLKPFFALVKREGVEQEEEHPEGVYALRVGREYETGTWSRDPVAAQCVLEKRRRDLEATAAAKAAGIEVLGNDGVPATLKETVQDFLEQLKPVEPTKKDFAKTKEQYFTEIKNGNKKKTFNAYSRAVNLFFESCGKGPGNPTGKAYLEDIDREDMLRFRNFLRTIVRTERTVANLVRNVKTFYLHYELPWPLKQKDMPKYTKKKAEAYDGENLITLLRNATADEADLIFFFLWTGGREQDVQYATWKMINWHRNTFWIKDNLEYGYQPKDREEAPIPLPAFLMERLRARRERHTQSKLIFSTKEGKPNGHLLRIVKDLALRAGLNCGDCQTHPRQKTDGTYNKIRSCKDSPVCEKWTLHQFRRTFTTFHSNRGVPINTIRLWLRHTDLETTLRYLASITSLEDVEKVKALAESLWNGDIWDDTVKAA